MRVCDSFSSHWKKSCWDIVRASCPRDSIFQVATINSAHTLNFMCIFCSIYFLSLSRWPPLAHSNYFLAMKETIGLVNFYCTVNEWMNDFVFFILLKHFYGPNNSQEIFFGDIWIWIWNEIEKCQKVKNRSNLLSNKPFLSNGSRVFSINIFT